MRFRMGNSSGSSGAPLSPSTQQAPRQAVKSQTNRFSSKSAETTVSPIANFDILPILQRYSLSTLHPLLDYSYFCPHPQPFMNSAPPVISVSGLVKKYGNHLAVDGVSFDVYKG